MGLLMSKEPFWEHPAEKNAHHKHLNAKQKATAKAHARAAGRPYPNLVDNAAVAKKGKHK
jgi:hypothetical protein